MEKTELGGCNSNQAALPCANNCGFYGSPANLNLCSKCYQEHIKSNPAAAAPLAAPEAVPRIDPVKPDDFSPPCKGDSAPAADVASCSADTERVSSPCCSPADAGPAVKQADTTRCWDCNARVGLLGFKCRCGYTYCKKHRQTEAHGCTFDFFGFNQEQLKRSNQKVVADKLERI